MPRLTWPHNIKLVDDVNEMCHYKFLVKRHYVAPIGRGTGSMNFDTRPEQKQTQKFILAPQMRLAIHMLHLPLIEFKTFLKNQIVENPVFEELDENLRDEKPDSDDTLLNENSSDTDENRKDEIDKLMDLSEPASEIVENRQYDEGQDEEYKYREGVAARSGTLYDHLLMQLGVFSRSDIEQTIGEVILGNIDKNGYLEITLDEIAYNLNAERKNVEKTLSLIQGFSPSGVGARNLSECLLLQLKQKGRDNSLAAKIAKTHLADLEKKKFKKIAKDIGISIGEIKNALSEISHLEPKPGRSFDNECSRYTTPDVLLHTTKNGYRIEMNTTGLPRLRISSRYKKLLKNKTTTEETRQYIRKKLEQASWLIKAAEQRNSTIKNIVEYVIKVQGDSLDNNLTSIKPLTLKEVAEATGVSVSTASRIVSNKHINTPHGIFALKRFFCGEIKQDNGEMISSQNIKVRIKELVSAEETSKPLSDESIIKMLRREDINIARRTVAKYREQLKIPPSNQRRSLCSE